MHRLQKIFETTPFCHTYTNFYLSIKDLEDAFNLFQNLHLCTQKSFKATSIRPFGEEVGAKSPLQLSSLTGFAKI